MLKFGRYEDQAVTLPNTPQNVVGDSPTQETDDSGVGNWKESLIRSPSMLCKWSIHIGTMSYEKLRSPSPKLADGIDPEDEDTWRPWPLAGGDDFSERLQSVLENNSFSNIQVLDLPVAVNQILKATERSEEQLFTEAFCFSIMARNWDLFAEHADQIADEKDTWLDNTNPLHLATSYLDGSKTCCNILSELTYIFPIIRKLDVNDLGHTVLDNLFLAIVKSHTSCQPSAIDDALKNATRFAGEEVDICGRWDADSPCVRALLAQGKPAIPVEWKHMFCHTSVQTICHCIGTIFGPRGSSDIDTPSGLFLKICTCCGQKLQLRPLHSLVLVAFHLARSGRPGETLFGVLSCLTCLLVNGANPLLRAEISIKALLGTDRADECSHEGLDPAELAKQVPQPVVASWSQEAQVGWNVLYRVLKFAQQERTRKPPQRQSSTSDDGRSTDQYTRMVLGGESEDEMDNESLSDENGLDDEFYECDHMKDGPNFYGESKDLGTLWAAIQTELLTYRRRVEGDPWISSNFDMHSVLLGLDAGMGIAVPIVEDGMMRPFCQCGRFLEGVDEACVTMPEACAHYFSNTEERSDHGKRSYITVPGDRMENWY